MLCYEKGCIGIILKGGKVEIFLVCHSYPEGGGGMWPFLKFGRAT